MFVLGIDPGLTRCGYGLVERAPRRVSASGRGSSNAGLGRRSIPAGGSSGTSGRHEMRAYGVLQTPHTDPINERLASLMGQLDALITLHRPDVVVVERVFFQTNARTAMGVAQASGLALALATKAGCVVAQYTSNEVKQAITGFGGAEKAQVQQMVARMLGLETIPKPADAADALALALHHLGVAPFTDSVAASIGSSSIGGALAAAISSASQGAVSGASTGGSVAKSKGGGLASPYGNARVATSAGGVKLRPHSIVNGESVEKRSSQASVERAGSSGKISTGRNRVGSTDLDGSGGSVGSEMDCGTVRAMGNAAGKAMGSAAGEAMGSAAGKTAPMRKIRK
jgi:crossover junction endodeoxyribonuclease RuvC